VHQGELPRVIKPQSGDALAGCSNSRLCKPLQLASNEMIANVLLDEAVAVSPGYCRSFFASDPTAGDGDIKGEALG
jgi:hypothetical protein